MLTMAVVIPATGFLSERFQMRTVFTLAMSNDRECGELSRAERRRAS